MTQVVQKKKFDLIPGTSFGLKTKNPAGAMGVSANIVNGKVEVFTVEDKANMVPPNEPYTWSSYKIIRMFLTVMPKETTAPENTPGSGSIYTTWGADVDNPQVYTGPGVLVTGSYTRVIALQGDSITWLLYVAEFDV